ncbi:hypothetical protein CYMTET_16412 [Cymbomonas tetramitiformis]|uniref:Uncharacterized protein n=1 Tax=Cymbomonas tetramitiformis TaxID=36881 RepID=A0AAE0GC67_9CHLO|nr:hypothetical protein CYMTET_16412 [Cymbomonas tetramitiformis]
MGECPDCGVRLDPTGTRFLACREGVGAGGGELVPFHSSQASGVLFDVAKSTFPLASALHDDFAGYLKYSPNHCPDITVLDAEGPGRHVMFDVATTRLMAEAQFGAAMMAPGAAVKRVEESKEEVDEGEDMREDEEGEVPLGCSMGWRERWIRELSFALAREVAGMFIQRAQGRCLPRAGWRWAGAGVLDGGGGPGPVRGEEGLQQVEGGQLALIAIDDGGESSFLTQASAHGGGSTGSPLESGASPARALELAVQGEQALEVASEAEMMASRLLGSIQGIWRDERASGWRGEDAEAGYDQEEPVGGTLEALT